MILTNLVTILSIFWTSYYSVITVSMRTLELIDELPEFEIQE